MSKENSFAISEAEAVRRVSHAFPDCRIVSGVDMGDFFAFQMLNRSIKPKSVLDIPFQPALNAIQKDSGKMFLCHAFLTEDVDFRGYIDVSKYLDNDDAVFVKEYEKMMEAV